MGETPRVSVVIPTWNGAALLAVCLPSLQRQTLRDFEVIVVDNGSTDTTAGFLAREHPSARLVRFEENRGFAAAVNAGIGAARGEIVVLMNNDTEADPGWLAALVDALDRHPEAGFCASRILRFDDRSRIDSAGDAYGLLPYSIGSGEPDGPAFARAVPVFSACAAGAAYRRSLFEEIGTFDERLNTYMEDVDLGIRAQLAGHACLYVPEARIYHMGGATAQRISERKAYYLMRNSLYLFFQYMPRSVVLRWGAPMLAFPFAYAARDRYPVRAAFRAVRDFLLDARGVLRRRREVARGRRLSPAEFRSLLSPLSPLRTRRITAPGEAPRP